MVVVFLQGCECLQNMTYLSAVLELWFIVCSMYMYMSTHAFEVEQLSDSVNASCKNSGEASK